jgi:hypothetical protein
MQDQRQAGRMTLFRLGRMILGCVLVATLLAYYWATPENQPGIYDLLTSIEKRGFQYFVDRQYPQTGLIADGSQWQPASTSATGFGLSAFVIGTERGWISRKDAEERVLLALNTCIDLINVDSMETSYCGFLYHFMNGRTGVRFLKAGFQSEISIVDMAILIAGALTAGEYFGGKVHAAAEHLYGLVQWNAFLDPDVGLFFGSWTPEKEFSDWYWDYYTDEIMLIDLLAIGAPSYAVNPDTFYAWKRELAIVDGETFVRSWSGSLFTYQLAHLWLDMKELRDNEGEDWWENSRKATIANRTLCIKYADVFASYGTNSWGVTPCFDPRYPRQYGGTLSVMAAIGEEAPHQDGTIAPAGAAGSLFLTPELSQEALLHYYQDIPRLWGEYGLKSAFNLADHWVAPMYFAIDLGITLLAVDDYLYGTIQRYFGESSFVKKALEKMEFQKAG